ncbi:MAG: cytochrome C, partial [Armatimonadetes bacterium]|nr:cytochrome C [Armatimonadota bacterium]
RALETCRSGERRGQETLAEHIRAKYGCSIKPLKLIKQENGFELAGRVAMDNVRLHRSRMECYTCHASWSPQCYGCHVKVDYSRGKTRFDWLAAGHRHAQPGHAADPSEGQYAVAIPGALEEDRSYTRWEDPMMGVNGEGRITPLAPGCQPSITVIGPDGKPLLLNHIFRAPPNTEGGGAKGQLCIDMSPNQPHTMMDGARPCESCHASDKALGYGISGGEATRPPDKPLYVDLETVDGTVLAKKAQVQCEPIEGLSHDWSRIVTEDGKQLQTVGHHFRLSRPLNNVERHRTDRRGVCLGCHKEIPERSPAVSLLHHVAEHLGQLPKNPRAHNALIHKILLFSAWGQVALGLGGPLLLGGGVLWGWRRRRPAGATRR